MSPGRKHAAHSQIKPLAPIHPSLETRSSRLAQSSSNAHQAHIPASVNEYLAHLRRSQRVGNTEDGSSQLPLPSSLSLQGRRRVPGPPPPRSWLVPEKHQEDDARDLNKQRPKKIDSFAKLILPVQKSLQHQTLRALAKNFEWHIEFDHTYLSLLPSKHKELLLGYISVFSDSGSQSLIVRGLEYLFPRPSTSDLQYTTSNEEIEQLELSGSIIDERSIIKLHKHWLTDSKAPTVEDVPESWDIPKAIKSPLRYPCLTRLSLSHPKTLVSWSELLDFSKHLGTLTHLSLAYFPIPCLASDFIETSSSAKAIGLDRDIDDRENNEWTRAVYILRRLSDNTSSLQWLSLEGCRAWWHALHFTPKMPRYSSRTSLLTGFDDSITTPVLASSTSYNGTTLGGKAAREIDWAGSWRHISYINLSQGWRPPERLTNKAMKVLRNFARLLGLDHQVCDTIACPTTKREYSAPLEYLSDDYPRAHALENIFASPRTADGLRHITTPSDWEKGTLNGGQLKRAWLRGEEEAASVEGRIRRMRKQAGLVVEAAAIEVDHGWLIDEEANVGFTV